MCEEAHLVKAAYTSAYVSIRSADVVYVLRGEMCEEAHLVKAAYATSARPRTLVAEGSIHQ